MSPVSKLTDEDTAAIIQRCGGDLDRIMVAIQAEVARRCLEICRVQGMDNVAEYAKGANDCAEAIQQEFLA